MTSLVVTLVGPDRPGMVRAISDAAAACGANWTDSLMANFAQQFAGIVHLQVAPEHCEKLAAALRALESPGLHIVVARSDASAPGPAVARMQLDLVGHDRPGIIHAISSQLAAHGVSIDKLQSHIESGAWSGEQMFHMQAQLTVPPTLDTHALRGALESLANELMVDMTFAEPGRTQP